MGKLSCVISCPISTYSGYGARSRDFVRAVRDSKPEWDIKILSQRWGNTRMSYLEDHNDTEFTPLIVPQMTSQPDVWIQITVPNEFQPIGKFNIGVTAGIETTICAPQWIEGCNKMDLVVTSSEHSKTVFEVSKFEATQNNTKTQLGLSKPIEVLFEGFDQNIYKKVEEVSLDLSEIEESFCFLVVGHWMQGNFGHDRKNIGYTVKAFLESFKNKSNPPALILKTSQATSSYMDRAEIVKRVQAIKRSVKGRVPNVYILHGDLTDEQMNELYNHSKIKSMVSLTKGEGFGRPLLEFSAVGKPIIASYWSGQKDFLNKEFVKLIPGVLENVHPSAAVKDVLLPESQWFKPEDAQVGRAFKDVHKNYKNYIVSGKRQARFVNENFTYSKMVDRLNEILTKYSPNLPEQVQLVLPKLSLPKLQKI